MCELVWRGVEIRISEAAAKSFLIRSRRSFRDDFFVAGAIRYLTDLVARAAEVRINALTRRPQRKAKKGEEFPRHLFRGELNAVFKPRNSFLVFLLFSLCPLC
jgi:hypothetical protein